MFTTTYTQDLALMNETAVFDGNFIDYYTFGGQGHRDQKFKIQ
jgi:hypothetical protein